MNIDEKFKLKQEIKSQLDNLRKVGNYFGVNINFEILLIRKKIFAEIDKESRES